MTTWPTWIPVLALAAVGGSLVLPDHAVLVVLAVPALLGAVIAAVHHAEVVAHRVGEPFGTLPDDGDRPMRVRVLPGALTLLAG